MVVSFFKVLNLFLEIMPILTDGLVQPPTTLPETNIFAPENGGPLEVWRFLLETHNF